MNKISILGCGGWGIALALTAFDCGSNVVMWSPFCDEVDALNSNHKNEKLLSGIDIPSKIKITTDISEADDSDITIIATPSFAVRETAARIKSIKNPGVVLIVAKGLESGSLLRLSQVVQQELPHCSVAVLSGPSHAEEVARKMPTSVVVASNDLRHSKKIQSALTCEFLRIYTNRDIIGVELGGALKNIIAIASGICEGMGLGDNTRAALITRGLTEIARLGVACGAHDKTFAGLSGLGDLIVTCTSRHSRNNRFGNLVGKGISVKEALEQVGTVEGYYATSMAYQLALKYGTEMPIVEQCYNIMYLGADTRECVRKLMMRSNKCENDGINI